MKLNVLRPVYKDFPVSSPFGPRIFRDKQSQHNGIDFACPVGTPVRSMFDGRVMKAGWECSPEKQPGQYKEIGYGLRVWQIGIIGDNKYYVWYGHLNEIFAQEGKLLNVGSLIGYSGNTGRSSGPHLHVGVRKKDTGIFYDMEFYDA